MLKPLALALFILASITLKSQNCWQKTVMNDSVFVIQEKYDIVNDTMCVIVIKADRLDCETLRNAKKMKQIEMDKFIEILIAKGFRVEIYRKREIFN